MNTPREQSQKLIGFKLFGNTVISLDTGELVTVPNKAFEIQFIPGIIPFGTLAELGKHDGKKIVVELSEEINQSAFERSCTFLLEKNAQLVVKEYGYEKLGNRKLHLEVCYHLKEPTVNVILFIQGKCNSFDYEIELNPYDLSCSTGEIRSSKKCIKANLNMEELIGIKKCDIIKVFSKLKQNNFNISIDGDRINIDLSSPLKQFIDSLGKPSKYQNIKTAACSNETVPQDTEEKTSLNNDEKSSKKGIWLNFKNMLRNN